MDGRGDTLVHVVVGLSSCLALQVEPQEEIDHDDEENGAKHVVHTQPFNMLLRPLWLFFGRFIRSLGGFLLPNFIQVAVLGSFLVCRADSLPNVSKLNVPSVRKVVDCD